MRELIRGSARDARFALRLLARDRGFAVTAILLLGLGIGVNNMMFTVIYGHTLRKLPIPDADRVLYISAFTDRVPDEPLSYPEFEALRQASSFAGVTAYGSGSATLAEDARAPERVEAAYVTSNAFDLIGRATVLGRMFTDQEDTAGAPGVALLGTGLWRSRYGGDESVLGRTVLLNGAAATVIGIVPDRSGFPSTASIWMPLAHMPGLARNDPNVRALRVFGRLRDNISVDDARAEVDAIVLRASQESTEDRRRARVVPISQRFLGRAGDPAWIAFMAVGFVVFLVSCANVANLLLARAVKRTREIAVRLSLGATRQGIVRQLLAESAVLAALGGVAGLVVSLLAVRLFQSAIPAGILPYWLNYDMDARIVAALVAVSFGTIVLSGLIPALSAARTDVNQTLKEGGQGTRSTRRWTTTFLVGQLALTVILLAQGVAKGRGAPPPVATDAAVTRPELMTASVTLPTGRYETPADRARFFALLEEQLRRLPELEAATLASTVPFRGAPGFRLEQAENTPAPGQALPLVRVVSIGQGYFDALGVSLERGDDRSSEGTDADPLPGIVSQRFAARFYPDGAVLGQRIRLHGSPPSAAGSRWITVTGVAPDVRYRSLPEAEPVVYLPLDAEAPASISLLVRSRAEPSATAAALRAAAMAVDPQLPIDRIRTMTDVRHEAEWNGRLAAAALNTLSFLGVCLITAGLYAVTTHGVGQRQREIAVRMALGARTGHVRRLVLKRAAWQVSLGLLFGIVCTMTWDAVLFSGSVRTRFAQPDVLVPVAGVLAAVMLIACLGPANRAARLDPGTVLKRE